MASFSDTVRCTRCLEEVSYLPDPRILPCSHVYCTDCLETISNTVESGLELQCFQCGTTHQLNDLAALSVAEGDKTDQKADYLYKADKIGPDESFEATEDEEDDNEAGRQKRCAKCTDREAVCFCIECGERYCKFHEELHNNWYGNHHKFISMDIYLPRPNKYIKPICKQHKQEITLACKLCFHLACGKCDTLEGKCDNGIEKHDFESLRGAEILLRAHFNKVLEECSESLSYMGKKEKETWQSLDLLQDDCEKMKLQVKEKVNQQIEQIRKEGDLILQDITAYESRNTSSVETYLQDLRTKREALERDILSCRQFLRDNHVSKIIRYRIQQEEKLHSHRIVDTRFDYQLQRLQDLGSPENLLHMEFAPKPLKLKFLSASESQPASFPLGSICSDDTGKEIYVAGGNRITKYSHDMTVLASLDTHCWVSSVITSGNIVYFVKYVQSDWILMKTSSNLTNPIHIAKYADRLKNATHLTINKSSVIASQRGMKSIHVYNEETDTSNIIPLKFAPRVVSTHQDGDLLITDTNGYLHKCRLRSTDAVDEIWCYYGLEDAYGICTMDNGFILLAGREQSSFLHVLSTEGKIIQVLKHEKLKEVLGGMCMINNILYLPCWSKGRVFRFELRAGDAE